MVAKKKPVEIDQRWRIHAACRGMDTELFFPHIPYAAAIPLSTRRQISQARQVCGVCPVRVECFSHALHFSESGGIWGGVLFNRHGQPIRHGRCL